MTPKDAVNRLLEAEGGPLSVVGYRVGNLDSIHKRGIFFSLDRAGAEAYASLHPDMEVKAYQIELGNCLRARHQNDVIQLFFKKTYGDFHDHHSRRLKNSVEGGRQVDREVMKAAMKAGYDGIYYSNPAPPAKQEVTVFDPSSVSEIGDISSGKDA